MILEISNICPISEKKTNEFVEKAFSTIVSVPFSRPNLPWFQKGGKSGRYMVIIRTHIQKNPGPDRWICRMLWTMQEVPLRASLAFTLRRCGSGR